MVQNDESLNMSSNFIKFCLNSKFNVKLLSSDCIFQFYHSDLLFISKFFAIKLILSGNINYRSINNETQLKQLANNSFNRRFLEALESDNVAEKLSDIIQHALLRKLDNKLNEIFATISQLRWEIDNKDAVIADRRNCGVQKSAKIQQLEARIADQNLNVRWDNLICSGLQMSYADL